MNLWKRIFVCLILVFAFLATLQLLKSLEIPEATAGYFVLITGSIASLVVAIGIILITLAQFFPKRAEEKKKEEQKKFEEIFTHELFRSKNADEIHRVVEIYRDRSTIAKTLSDPRIDEVGIAKKLLDNYSQGKVRKTVEYLMTSGRGYLAIGTVLKHLIEHHKIPSYQARILEKELRDLMPKRDIISLYEKVR